MEPHPLLKSPVSRRFQRQGIALLEAIIALALVSTTLGCLFAMNGQLLSRLKQGKEGTYATQLIQERVEQLRTSLWSQFTNADNLRLTLLPPTATAANLREVTESVEIEPLENPLDVRILAVRTPAGAVNARGPALINEPSVKITFSISWRSRGDRVRTRSMVTILTNGGI